MTTKMSKLGTSDAFVAGLGLAIGLTMGQYIAQLMKPIEKPTKPIIICHKCGNQNPSENKFCGICGKALYPPPPIQCPKCGAAMPPNIKFCRRCGFPLRKPATTRKKRD